MDASSSTTTEDPASATSSVVLKIPDGYKVSCWKVSDGSVVHSGETVALVIPVGSEKDDSHIAPTITDPSVATAGSQTEKSSHKRPSRRKRPLASQALSSAADRSESRAFASIEEAPTVHSLNDPKSRISGIPITATAAKQHDSSVVAIQAPVDGIVRIYKFVVPNPKEGRDIEIGSIVQCQHPTVVSGLCAVCGVTLKTNVLPNDDLSPGTMETTNTNSAPNSNARNTNGMTVMTVSGMTVSISEAESKRMAQEDTQRLRALRKLSLVLDLDHTLLHATADPRAELQCHRSDVRRLVLPFMTMEMNPFQQPQQHTWLQHHFIKLRPHVKEFLELAMHQYEMGVYTAGTREYAEEIAMILARHLVGAERDQFDLNQLRQQFVHAEQLYLRQQATWKNSETKLDESRPNFDDSISNVDGQPISVEGPASNKIEGTKPSAHTKRKRVQFGITPPSTRTDEVSEESLIKLRAELNEAERLEQVALNMRQKLFGSRVMSRTEAGEMGRHVKSLKRIFPCGGSMAAVIDDREDVWANAGEDMRATRRGEPPENLLLVRPYHWSLFHGYADVNNASGFDFLHPDTESEIDTDEQLLWTAHVLNNLHHRYYSYSGPHRPTVPDILEQMRSSVLQGCNVVLSGLVPLAKQNNDPSRPRPSFVRYAESLGAQVLSSITNSVTHVVAAKDGTDKILAARRIKDCFVVRPTWLVECVWSLTRRDETPHLLGVLTKPKENVEDPVTEEKESESTDFSSLLAPDNSSSVPSGDDNNDDDNDEEDDDFAADLENELMSNDADPA
jgi:RNA polymerase II subunit A C-terminal domain phosphatase